MKKSSFFFVHDLNSFSLMGDHMHTFSAGDGYVCRSTCVLPSDDLFASESLQSHGCSTSSATQSTRLHLFGPVPRFGFRSVDHTRVFARYRDQFACSKAAFLSYGPALQDHLEKHSGKRQSSEALGSFCGSRAPFDCNCTKALRQRTDQRRIQIPHGSDGICARFDDHRSVFESVQLGSISHRQSRHQTSYFDRLEGIDSQFYPHQRRQNARRQSTRYPLQARLHRGWRVLRDGQGLRRLCKIVSVAYGQSFLCEWAKDNLQAQLVQEFIVDTSAGLISDRHVRLTGLNSAKRYPEALRCVRFTDPESNKTLEFLTNNFALPAITICALYKQRWQVELFFKWIKQHLRIKSFYGTTENAVKTQVWIAISTYVLIAIMKKRLNLQHSLYEILRVLDLNMFEIVPIADLLGQIPNESQIGDFPVQQDLFQTLGH